jgi:hypothetical protein
MKSLKLFNLRGVLIMIYIIVDAVHDEILAATLTQRQAEEFMKNVYRCDYGYSEDEIAQEMADMRDDDCDSVLYIREVAYTDGFYHSGEYDNEGNWIPPKYIED